MSLSPEQLAFLKQRQGMVKNWRVIGPPLLVLLGVFYFMLLFTAPILLNPFAVMNRLQAKTLNITTLQTMAIIQPMMLSLLCFVLLLFILFMYRAVRNERRHLDVIAALQAQAAPPAE